MEGNISHNNKKYMYLKMRQKYSTENLFKIQFIKIVLNRK